jgi:hypothetical protein
MGLDPIVTFKEARIAIVKKKKLRLANSVKRLMLFRETLLIK